MKKNTITKEEEVISEEVPTELKVPQFQRCEVDGLVVGGGYKYNPDGTINWRAMIKKEYLVPNKDRFPAGTDFSSLDVSTLEDNQLLILLGGIKDLAMLRGFEYVDYEVIKSERDYVSVKCTISWLPIFENDLIFNKQRCIKFSALADAHHGNCSGFGNNFLMAIAENRAFVRAVRNFLRINIVGQDEVDSSKKGSKNEDTSHSDGPPKPVNILSKAMQEAGLSFESIKSKLITEGNELASTWESAADIPTKTIFEIIERIKKKNKK
jgi:hypothetical protein